MNPMRVARAAVEQFGALQKPEELASFLSFLLDNPPAVVVEIGCDAGGTLFAWQQLVACRAHRSYDADDLVIGVNLPGGRFASGKPLDAHGATMVYGDSHDLDTVDELRTLLDGRPIDLLFIDGDHTYEGVRDDFLLYAPLVADSGVIAFHDVVPHPNHPDVGVQDFWQQLGGDKEEIVVGDPSWGGIGFVRQAALVTA